MRYQYDSILLVIYRIPKSANIEPVKTTHLEKDYDKISIWELVRLFKFPLFIILGRGV